MTLLPLKIEKACYKCGSESWQAQKKGRDVCGNCGKLRSVSNWISRVGGMDKSTGTRVKALAQAFDAKRLVAYKENGATALRPKKVPTLAGFSKVYLEFLDATYDLKDSTKAGYRDDIKLLQKTPLWKMRLNEIGPADVSVIKISGGASNWNHAVRILHRIMTFAAEKDLLKAVPSFKMRKENKRRAVIERGPMEDGLLELASPVLRDFLIIALDCGMRPEEIARIRWEHILWADKQILVPYGKTDRAERHVPLTERMAAVLRVRKASVRGDAVPQDRSAAAGTRTEYIFPGRAKREYASPEAMSQNFRDLVVAYGKRKPALPEGLVLYSCRHSFATRFLKASGGDKAALKEIMGHSSFTVSERYVHGAVTEAAAIMDRFNQRDNVVQMRRA